MEQPSQTSVSSATHKKAPTPTPQVTHQAEPIVTPESLTSEALNPGVTLQRAHQGRPADVLALQRMAGNRAVNQMLTARVQAKPIVQRCFGNEEIQAKRLLQPLTGLVQRHESGCGCSSCTGEIQRHADEEVQTKRIQRSEAAHGNGCTCAACSPAIQRDADEDVQMKRIQRSEATHGNSCNCVACATIQRRSADYFLQRYPAEGAASIKLARQVIPTTSVPAANPRVQRHSSWEHKALGDIVPVDLAIMGAARNLKAGKDGKKGMGDEAFFRDLAAEEKNGKGPEFTDQQYVIKATDRSGKTTRTPITRAMVLHVIEQEIRRLNHFKNLDQITKTAKSAADVEKRLKAEEKQAQINAAMEQAKLDGKDVGQAAIDAGKESPEWDVRIIQLPLKDGAIEYITYGEMNTLADIYGSVDEMRKTDPKNLHGIILGIRQQSLFRFMELYEEVSGTTKYQEAAEATKEKKGFFGKLWSGLKRFGGGVLGAAGGAVAGAVAGAFAGIGVGAMMGYRKGGVLGAIGGGLLGALATPFTIAAGAIGGMAVGGMAGSGVGPVKKFLSPEKNDKYSGLGFDGAIGNTGVQGANPGNLLGELRFMNMIPGQQGKKLVGDDKTTDYSAGLARNACHFPPDSWNAWERYHTEAIRLAKDSNAKALAGQADEASKSQSEALVHNGFGDHFLQDSYAAGHLIDKTKIMKMYVRWIDKEGKWDFHQDKDWRRVQNIAYGQKDFAGGDNRYTDNTPRDPQMVENLGGDMAQKHDQLGLKIADATTPGSDAFSLLKWWVDDVLSKWRIRNPREKKVQTLLDNGPLGQDLNRLELALRQLYAQGIVRVGSYDTKQRGAASVKVKMSETVVLREDYIPDTKEEKASYKVNAGDALKGLSQKANIKDYGTFINSALLQKSTNALHDYFCEKGLDVVTGDGNEVYRVYGDDAMLQTNSALGVQHSNKTAHMSREAVETAVATGTPKHTMAEIKNRFPQKIKGEGLAPVSLKDWHDEGQLKEVCEKKVFPGMRKDAITYVIQVFAMGLKGGLGEIHNPHGGAAVF